MASKASAVWTGSLKEGKGTISTATGVIASSAYAATSEPEIHFERREASTTECAAECAVAVAFIAASPC